MSAKRSGGLAVFNRTAALTYCDNDPQLLLEIVRSFQRTWRASLQELQAALAAGDAQALEQQAHKLKGRAAIIGAEATSKAALSLEDRCRDGEMQAAPAALEALEAALEALDARLIKELSS